MNADQRQDERIARLLAASRTSANPAVLARAQARLAARDAEEPAWVGWLGRPSALIAACALLVMSCAVSFTILRADRVTAASASTSLVSALLDDDGSYGLPTSANGTTGSTLDSGEVAQ